MKWGDEYELYTLVRKMEVMFLQFRLMQFRQTLQKLTLLQRLAMRRRFRFIQDCLMRRGRTHSAKKYSFADHFCCKSCLSPFYYYGYLSRKVRSVYFFRSRRWYF